MKEHMKSSMEIAQHLLKHPKIEEVIHPGLANAIRIPGGILNKKLLGLPNHEDNEIFKKQASGWSGMMAFKIKGAGKNETLKFLNSLKFITFAGSLGGVESLAHAP
jgi:cystathionine beta-lyase/cystathionine gamma-synthase